jgi:hypothetical protein
MPATEFSNGDLLTALILGVGVLLLVLGFSSGKQR